MFWSPKEILLGLFGQVQVQNRCRIENLNPIAEFMKAAGKLYYPINPTPIMPNSDTGDSLSDVD